jgi:hypothetical protein
MKKIITLVLIFIVVNIFAQGKYLTKNGTLSFEASVPSFEEVAAINKSVTAILNAENGEFAALSLVKGFRFKNALMEEHFNENYAESSDYPKAIFKGKLDGFLFDKISSNQDYTINGELTFHGVTKSIKQVKITLIHKGDSITMSGNFIVKAADFNIKIPKIVASKVSEKIKVDFKFLLKLK